MENETIKRGDIFIVDLGVREGHLQGKARPCCVVSNDIGNKRSSIANVVPISSKIGKNLPTHMFISASKQNGLTKDSILLCEQILTINTDKIKSKKLGNLNELELRKLDRTLEITLTNALIDKNKINKNEWFNNMMSLKSDIMSLDKFICLCINKNIGLFNLKNEIEELRIKINEFNKVYRVELKLNCKELLEQNKIMAM